MGVYATTEIGEWECEECGHAFLSLFAPDSDTKPECPYCRITTLEAKLEASERLIEKLSYDHECCDPENCRFCIAVDALTTPTAEENSSG